MPVPPPAESGPKGWNPQHEAPPFFPERSPALNFAFRRWPAAIRILADDLLLQIEAFPESKIYDIVRFWLHPDRKKTLKIDISAPPDTRSFREWLSIHENYPLRSWWKHTRGWKSPKEFAGYTAVCNEAGILRPEPHEVANFRLPDDISTDADVVLFKAWCEGVTFHRPSFIPRHHPLSEGAAPAIRKGLAKFGRSPWVQLAMVAPFMQPTGVLFPRVGYIDSSIRLQYLLKHPYESTLGELPYILQSQMFKASWNRALRARIRGDYLPPDGAWYAGGGLSMALGPNFRRGNVFHGSGGGSKASTRRRYVDLS